MVASLVCMIRLFRIVHRQKYFCKVRSSVSAVLFLLTVRRSCVSCCLRSHPACPGSATRRAAAPWCRVWTRGWCPHPGPPDLSETPEIGPISGLQFTALTISEALITQHWPIRGLHYNILANQKPTNSMTDWPGGDLSPPTPCPAPPQGWGRGWAPAACTVYTCTVCTVHKTGYYLSIRM